MSQVQAEPKANGKEAHAPLPNAEPKQGAALKDTVEQKLNEGVSICVRGATLALALIEAGEADRTINYILEDAVVNGVKAMRRSREYSADTRNQREFTKELRNDPTIAADINRMHALLRKYKLPVPLTAQEK